MAEQKDSGVISSCGYTRTTTTCKASISEENLKTSRIDSLQLGYKEKVTLTWVREVTQKGPLMW